MLNDKIPIHEEEWFEKLAIKIFSDIENLTKDKIGISRESYGRGETLSINYLTDLAEEFGFYVEKDDAANIVLSLDKSIKTNYILIKSIQIFGVRAGEFFRRSSIIRKKKIIKAIFYLFELGVFKLKKYKVKPFNKLVYELTKIRDRKSIGKIIIKTKYLDKI